MGDIWNIKEQYKRQMGSLWIRSNSKGNRGMFGGGYAPSYNNTVQYLTLSTLGNAADFGDLTVSRSARAVSSFTRFVCGGGNSPPGLKNEIDYFTIASTGNGADFGDLSGTRAAMGGKGNNTRGVFSGGITPSNSNIMEYISMAHMGNTVDFGNLTVARHQIGTANSPTRGISAGSSAPTDTIDYIQFATLGDATDFGDLTSSRYCGSTTSSTRGVFAGGGSSPPFSNIIDFIEIASTGDAADFGDLTSTRTGISCSAATSTRGIFAGGREPTVVDKVEYITIASAGDSVDFGDLTNSPYLPAGGSDGHGGLPEGEPRGLPLGSGRAYFGGGETPARVGEIQEIHIPTLGSVADFGDAITGYSSTKNGANSYTRAILMNRLFEDSPYVSNEIESFEMHSRGNCADFGDLSTNRREGGNLSSSTRGITGGGQDP